MGFSFSSLKPANVFKATVVKPAQQTVAVVSKAVAPLAVAVQATEQALVHPNAHSTKNLLSGGVGFAADALSTSGSNVVKFGAVRGQDVVTNANKAAPYVAAVVLGLEAPALLGAAKTIASSGNHAPSPSPKPDTPILAAPQQGASNGLIIGGLALLAAKLLLFS